MKNPLAKGQAEVCLPPSSGLTGIVCPVTGSFPDFRMGAAVFVEPWHCQRNLQSLFASIIVAITNFGNGWRAVPLLNRNMEHQPEHRIVFQSKQLTRFVPCSGSLCDFHLTVINGSTGGLKLATGSYRRIFPCPLHTLYIPFSSRLAACVGLQVLPWNTTAVTDVASRNRFSRD